ncbi:transcriptional regulator [Micractinium conductrix]|uniref:Transcriptional regulator n=1 Tax=Micractinium conductrix TaxID=554055 RepID=A0A2P6V139_9CHLO|nr:transcriptional regulator [Micractinium conductrix]|eukprot:PSC67808.1 transcriptional regulator [Micractinium conductrix]
MGELAASEEVEAAAGGGAGGAAPADAGAADRLLRGAVLIARHRHPLVSEADIREQLDDLAVQVAGRLPADPYPLKVLQTISAHLHGDRGFCGNKEDYYDPNNSCINVVLERRLGIPISLGLVYMQVAQRLGVPMVGVNLPGHFFIAPADPSYEFFVDAFAGGEISFHQDVEDTLTGIYRRPVRLDPAALANRQPLPERTFLARMLSNLKQIYNLRQSFAEAYAISLYLRATRPGDLEELRDSGVYLYRLGRIPECVETLTQFVARAPPGSEDVAKVQALLRALEQR